MKFLTNFNLNYLKSAKILSSFLLVGYLLNPLLSTESFAIEIGVTCSDVDDIATCSQTLPEEEVGALNNLLKLAGDIEECREESGGGSFTCSNSNTGEIVACTVDGAAASCSLPDGTQATCNEVGVNGAACTIVLPDEDTVAASFEKFANGRVQTSFVNNLSKVCTERTASAALQRDCSDLIALVNNGDPTAEIILEQISPTTAALAGNMGLFSQAAQNRNIQDRLEALRNEREGEQKAGQLKNRSQDNYVFNFNENENENETAAATATATEKKWGEKSRKNNNQQKILKLASKYLYAFNRPHHSQNSYEDTQPLSEIQLAALSIESDQSSTNSDKNSVSGFSRLGSFINVVSVNTEKDSTATGIGAEVTLSGFTAGLDYRFNSALVMGLALGVSQGSGDFLEDRGTLDTNGFTLTYYGTYYWPTNIYFDMTLNYGGTDFKQARRIQYSGSGTNVNQTASADYFGSQTQFAMTTGLEWEVGSWLINPYVQWQSILVEIDEYSEEMSQSTTAGSGWALTIEDQSIDANSARIGAQASFAISRSWGVITPIARLEIVHELDDEGRLIAGRFVGDRFGRNSFEISTGQLDSSYFYSGLGVTSVHRGGFSTFLFLQTLSGYDNVSQREVSLGARWTL